MEVLIVQRIHRQLFIKLCPCQFLVEQWEGRVIKTDGILVDCQQFIVLRSDIHRISKGQAVFLRHRRWRIQFVIGRLQRLCHFAAQHHKHPLATLRQMGIVCNDKFHGRAHHGKNEFALRSTGQGFLLTNHELAGAIR